MGARAGGAGLGWAAAAWSPPAGLSDARPAVPAALQPCDRAAALRAPGPPARPPRVRGPAAAQAAEGAAGPAPWPSGAAWAWPARPPRSTRRCP